MQTKVTVPYTMADDIATVVDSDYTAVTGTAMVIAGQTATTMGIPTTSDTTVDMTTPSPCDSPPDTQATPAATSQRSHLLHRPHRNQRHHQRHLTRRSGELFHHAQGLRFGGRRCIRIRNGRGARRGGVESGAS